MASTARPAEHGVETTLLHGHEGLGASTIGESSTRIASHTAGHAHGLADPGDDAPALTPRSEQAVWLVCQ